MKIGTRGSELARAQAGIIAGIIQRKLELNIEIEIIRTRGDVITDRPLRELEGRGYFTREIEEALLDGRVDLAVHSFKDMPSQSPEGLKVAAVSRREDPADVLIIREEYFDPEGEKIPISRNAAIGTSAVRRESQLKALRNDLRFRDLRGNVPTRLEKLAKGEYDAIILASAGLRRLDLELSEFRAVRLNPEEFVPSPGQGALAVQMRIDDEYSEAIADAINDPDTSSATSIERGVMAMFGGGCGLPLGVYAYKEVDIWRACGFWGGNENLPRWAKVSGKNRSELSEKLYNELTND